MKGLDDFFCRLKNRTQCLGRRKNLLTGGVISKLYFLFGLFVPEYFLKSTVTMMISQRRIELMNVMLPFFKCKEKDKKYSISQFTCGVLKSRLEIEKMRLSRIKKSV